MPPLGGQVPIPLPTHRYRHLRDRYAAEVFLSLGAVKDGEAFFRAALANATGDEERLSSALVLSQFLLVQQRHDEYAHLIADTVLPLLPRCHRPVDAGEAHGPPARPDHPPRVPPRAPRSPRPPHHDR